MMTVSEFHNYLSMVWYGYGCADKDQITQIIKDELAKPHNMSRDKLKLHIKRKCQAEAGR